MIQYDIICITGSFCVRPSQQHCIMEVQHVEASAPQTEEGGGCEPRCPLLCVWRAFRSIWVVYMLRVSSVCGEVVRPSCPICMLCTARDGLTRPADST